MRLKSKNNKKFKLCFQLQCCISEWLNCHSNHFLGFFDFVQMQMWRKKLVLSPDLYLQLFDSLQILLLFLWSFLEKNVLQWFFNQYFSLFFLFHVFKFCNRLNCWKQVRVIIVSQSWCSVVVITAYFSWLQSSKLYRCSLSEQILQVRSQDSHSSVEYLQWALWGNAWVSSGD